MAIVVNLYTWDDWQRALAGPAPVLLFKHSTSCGVSARAHYEFQQWAAAQPPGIVLPALVRVIEERPLSLRIAQVTGVPHASPQAILLWRDRALWHDSHQAITQAALGAALAKVSIP